MAGRWFEPSRAPTWTATTARNIHDVPRRSPLNQIRSERRTRQQEQLERLERGRQLDRRDKEERRRMLEDNLRRCKAEEVERLRFGGFHEAEREARMRERYGYRSASSSRWEAPYREPSSFSARYHGPTPPFHRSPAYPYAYMDDVTGEVLRGRHVPGLGYEIPDYRSQPAGPMFHHDPSHHAYDVYGGGGTALRRHGANRHVEFAPYPEHAGMLGARGQQNYDGHIRRHAALSARNPAPYGSNLGRPDPRTHYGRPVHPQSRGARYDQFADPYAQAEQQNPYDEPRHAPPFGHDLHAGTPAQPFPGGGGAEHYGAPPLDTGQGWDSAHTGQSWDAAIADQPPPAPYQGSGWETGAVYGQGAYQGGQDLDGQYENAERGQAYPDEGGYSDDSGAWRGDGGHFGQGHRPGPDENGLGVGARY